MKVVIDRATLARATAFGAAVAERKSTMPIIANALLRAEDDRLVLCATDLSASVTVEMRAGVEREGACTLPAGKLHDIARAAADGEIVIEAGRPPPKPRKKPARALPIGDAAGQNGALEADQAATPPVLDPTEYSVEVRAGKSRYRMVGLPPRDFPKIDSGGVGKEQAAPSWADDVGAAALAGLLRAVLPAAAASNQRYYERVHLLPLGEGRIRAVATNGYWLAVADAPLVLMLPEGGTAVPVRAVGLLLRVLDGAEKARVGLRPDKREGVAGTLFVRAEDGEAGISATAAVKLLTDPCVAWEQIVPKDARGAFVVERAVLVAAVKRVARVGDAALFDACDGGLRLSAASLATGEAAEEIEGEVVGDAPRLAIDKSFLLDALGATLAGVERVRVAWSGDLDPMTLRPTDADWPLAVIMPTKRV